MPVRQIKYSEPAGPDWGARAFALPEARYKAQVMEHTWGHLSPEQGRWYFGYIQFSMGCHGTTDIIDWQFRTRDGEPLDYNPWTYEDMYDWIADFSMTKRSREGAVYQFVGRYGQSAKTGRYKFVGRIQRLRIRKPRVIVDLRAGQRVGIAKA